jgi:GTP pyrophosphokinase
VIKKIAPGKNEAAKKEENLLKKFLSKARGSAKGVRVQGLDNLLINFGKCCQPVPGDRILGFITQGQGVVIHRSDCKNILKLMENPERNIEVEWDVERDKHFMVRLHMLGEDRKNFLRDVSDSISQTDTNIVSVEMRAQDSLVHSSIIIEVQNLQHLTRVINKISNVKGVINVERLDGTGEPVPEA